MFVGADSEVFARYDCLKEVTVVCYCFDSRHKQHDSRTHSQKIGENCSSQIRSSVLMSIKKKLNSH